VNISENTVNCINNVVNCTETSASFFYPAERMAK